jgi:hypothetical protein
LVNSRLRPPPPPEIFVYKWDGKISQENISLLCDNDFIVL